MGLKVVIGVDGGGTKTDVAIADLTGQIIAKVRGEAVLPQFSGIEAAFDQLEALIQRALPTDSTPVAGAFFLSGADYESERLALSDAVKKRCWAPVTLVENDTFAILPTGDAAALICGTGVNCAGRHGTRIFRYPAIGMLSGDWGGGKDLTEHAVWHAVRGADGRGPHTCLTEAICELTSSSDIYLAAEDFYLKRKPTDQVPQLVFQCARQGDTVAQELVARQVDELVKMAELIQRDLEFTGPVPMALGGSVVAAGHQQLNQPLFSQLTDLGFTPFLFHGRPVDGAISQALALLKTHSRLP